MFERLTALLWKPRSDTVQTGSCQGAAMVGDTRPGSLTLPRRLDHVDEWTPPRARNVAASVQASALVALFQSEGRTGPVPHWELLASYPELCWMRGFVEVSERVIWRALGQICAKVRPRLDRGDGTVSRVVCYVIPVLDVSTKTDKANLKSAPKGNVVPIGNMDGRKRPIQAKRARTGMRKQHIEPASKSDRFAKGARHRADIVSAVA